MSSAQLCSRLSVFVLTTVFLLCLAQPLRAQAGSDYWPALTPADDADLGFVLVNTESATVEVTLTARGYDGVLVAGDEINNPATLTMPPGGQLVLKAIEVFGAGISGKAGWVELGFSAAGVKASSFVLRHGFGVLEAAPLHAVPARRFVFPKISAKAQTRLNVINVSGLAVNTRISLYDNSGAMKGEVPLMLAAFAGFNGSVADLAPEMEFEGYAVVESESDSLVGLETYASHTDLAAIQAISEDNWLSSGYWPHFTTLPGYSSKVTLINFSDERQVLRITAVGLSENGAQAAGPMFVERALLPHQRLEESVEQMFNLFVDSPVTGYLRFETESNARAVIGSLEHGAGNGAALSASEPSATGYSDAYFPFVIENDAYYAGLALLNPNSEAASILLEVIQDGKVTASTVLTLNAGEYRARFLDGIFQQPIGRHGHIRMSATLPVFGLESLGSRGLDSLVNVAAQPEADAFMTLAAAGNTPPSITSLSPSSVVANSVQSLRLDILGANFTKNATVRYDGVKMRTSFMSSTLLSITLSSAQLNVGLHSVQVYAPPNSSSNTVQFTVNQGAPPPVNQPPVVNAGPDQTLTLPASATLTGAASDDGLPNGALTNVWSTVSGPGSVTFANAASLTTTATFSASGAYVLRLTASDGALSSADDVTITANAPAPSNTYYVSTTGNDSNPGSSTSPWRTIQKAANTLSAGQTAIVVAGTYNERVQVTRSGIAGAPIAFQANGTVIMQGFNVQAGYIKITGFEITNTPGASPTDRSRGSGFYISGTANEVSGNYIHHTVAAGIYLTSSAGNTNVANNRVAYAVECAIYIQGSGNLIASNDISHIRSVSGSDADGIRFFGSGNTVRKNYIHDMMTSDSPGQSPHLDAFQTWGPATDYVFEQNLIDKQPSHQQAFTIEGLTQPVGNIVIRNNVFITRGAGYQPDVNAGDLGLVTNVTIANNTMVAVNGAVEYAIWLFKNLRGAVVKNNAIYDHGNSSTPYIRVDSGASTLDMGFNSISKSDGKPPVGSPYPGDLWMVNPQFVNFAARDFHLQSTSPLIDAGALLDIVPNDYDGTPRPLGVTDDIGSFEKQ
jgi:parallel beta-helix repeat protein